MVTKQLNKTQTKPTPSIKIKVPVSRHVALDEGDIFASFCPEFCVASSGLTEKEACDNLDEALEAFFEIANFKEILHCLTEDITEYLEIWGITAKKDEIEKSRQRALRVIVTALFDALQSKNGVAPAHLANDTARAAPRPFADSHRLNKNSQHRTGALQFQHEIANAPA